MYADDSDAHLIMNQTPHMKCFCHPDYWLLFTVGSLVRPKMVSSVHYCPATKKTIERRYTDMTSLDPFPSTAAYPTKDEDGNPLETEFGLSRFKDHQSFSIQVRLILSVITPSKET